MVIWSRYGFLVIVIGFVGLLFTQLAVDSLTGIENYYLDNKWPKILGGIIVAVPIWFLGSNLNRPNEEILETENATGNHRVDVRGGKHTFFFVPMQYWAPIIIAITVAEALDN